MELCKYDVPDLSQLSVSVMNREESRQSVHRRSAGLTSRVRAIDCMLADILAQVQMLGQEKNHLELVREKLTRMEPR